ncbi:ribosomal-processing cysteine protease Prp [Insulibacter thermoxylanivorax]
MRDQDGMIIGYSVDGHAQYDEPGKDIVCAGTSAIAVGTYNAIESLLGLKPKYVMRKGKMRVDLTGLAISDEETRQRLNLLLESMIVMMKTIEASYGDYIAVTDTISSE